MDFATINTTQNVPISYELAGLGMRLLAIILDTIFKGIYFFIFYIIFITGLIKNSYSDSFVENDTYNQIIIGIFILITIPGLLLNLICETFMNGQSFGKKIVGIKVIKQDGSQANFSSQLLRSMFRIIDHLFIGLISVAVTDKGQRIGDLVAKTLVVRVNHKYSLHNTILYQQTQAYELVYNQVALMNDEEANIIKEVIDFSHTQNQPEHINKLANKLKTKYGITSTQSNLDFLQTLLKDYSHYSFEK